MKLVKPKALRPGDSIGIFTPSSPCHVWFKEKYEFAKKQIESAGFKVVEGTLTEKFISEGYRSGSPKERAEEFMQLIRYPEVKCLMSTIGGISSNAMIEHLDYDEILRNPKIICGYSDVTSLHMAIHNYTGLVTFYGPAVIPTFGEHPKAFDFSVKSFLDAVQFHREGKRELEAPSQWSNQMRDAFTSGWKTGKRKWESNPGWFSLVSGKVKGPLLVANFNTLMSCAGTTYFPKLEGKILLLEEMECELGMQERKLVQLKNIGAFDKIKGLIVSKPEFYKNSDAPFEFNDLLLEIIGEKQFPIMTNFDCGHTHPMITLGQGISAELHVKKSEAKLTLLEAMIEE
ncbi:MAG: LD-carboxypeptidase [Bacteriovoracaceae bacterium]|nr:LD-carboxypeptidase [Bacteriovoracaceae bacterium]